MKNSYSKNLKILSSIILIVIISVYVFITFALPQVIAAGAVKNIQERYNSELMEDGMLHLITVGNGSPSAEIDRAQACYFIIGDDNVIMIDAGAGSAIKSQYFHMPLGKMSAVFLTHMHSDHIADLPVSLVNSWIYGRNKSIPVIGPAGTRDMIDGFKKAYRIDWEMRIAAQQNKLSLAQLYGTVKEIVIKDKTKRQLAFEGSNGFKVYAFRVKHGNKTDHEALGYRIEYKGNIIGLSGDTERCENVSRHAKNADILVHEVMNDEVLQLMVNEIEEKHKKNNLLSAFPELIARVKTNHTGARDVGEISARAGVRRLVLSHVIGSSGPSLIRKIFFNPSLKKQVREKYKGEIVIADDGDVFSLKGK